MTQNQAESETTPSPPSQVCWQRSSPTSATVSTGLQSANTTKPVPAGVLYGLGHD